MDVLGWIVSEAPGPTEKLSAYRLRFPGRPDQTLVCKKKALQVGSRVWFFLAERPERPRPLIFVWRLDHSYQTCLELRGEGILLDGKYILRSEYEGAK